MDAESDFHDSNPTRVTAYCADNDRFINLAYQLHAVSSTLKTSLHRVNSNEIKAMSAPLVVDR